MGDSLLLAIDQAHYIFKQGSLAMRDWEPATCLRKINNLCCCCCCLLLVLFSTKQRSIIACVSDCHIIHSSIYRQKLKPSILIKMIAHDPNIIITLNWGISWYTYMKDYISDVTLFTVCKKEYLGIAHDTANALKPVQDFCLEHGIVLCLVLALY